MANEVYRIPVACDAGAQARLSGQPCDVDTYLRAHPVPQMTLEELVAEAYRLGWRTALESLSDEAATLIEQAVKVPR
jgi:hypothetical protein